MKANHITLFLVLCFVFIGFSVNAQYDRCPNGPGDNTAKIAWRLRDASTDVIITGPLSPNTVYKLEIYETPYNPVPPLFISYQQIGVKGLIDGFRLYGSVGQAISSPGDYFPDWAIEAGLTKDVGSTGGVSTWGIRTLEASDPNWTGQLLAYWGYAICHAANPPGGPIRDSIKILFR